MWKELHFPRYEKFGIIAYTERSREEKVLFSEMINRVLGSHQTSVDITKGTFSCGGHPGQSSWIALRLNGVDIT